MKFTLSKPINNEEACELLKQNVSQCPDIKNIELKNAYGVKQIKLKAKLNNFQVMTSDTNGNVVVAAMASMMVQFLFILFITIPISIATLIAYSYDEDEAYVIALVIGAIIGIIANIVVWKMRQPEKKKIMEWVQETLNRT